MERPPPSNRYELKGSHAVLAARAILSHQAGDVPPEGKKTTIRRFFAIFNGRAPSVLIFNHSLRWRRRDTEKAGLS